MSEQLRLFDVPREQPVRFSPALILLGKHWVAECRKVLDESSRRA